MILGLTWPQFAFFALAIATVLVLIAGGVQLWREARRAGQLGDPDRCPRCGRRHG